MAAYNIMLYAILVTVSLNSYFNFNNGMCFTSLNYHLVWKVVFIESHKFKHLGKESLLVIKDKPLLRKQGKSLKLEIF